jgi:hypothetical protein
MRIRDWLRISWYIWTRINSPACSTRRVNSAVWLLWQNLRMTLRAPVRYAASLWPLRKHERWLRPVPYGSTLYSGVWETLRCVAGSFSGIVFAALPIPPPSHVLSGLLRESENYLNFHWHHAGCLGSENPPKNIAEETKKSCLKGQ